MYKINEWAYYSLSEAPKELDLGNRELLSLRMHARGYQSLTIEGEEYFRDVDYLREDSDCEFRDLYRAKIAKLEERLDKLEEQAKKQQNKIYELNELVIYKEKEE